MNKSNASRGRNDFVGIWEFKQAKTGEDRLPVNVNFGFGANVVMDRGDVEPKLRIRAQNLAFHFFPDPYLEFRGKLPLGDTNLAVCARYRIPVSSVRNIWETRNEFRIYLCHRSGRLFHLTPGGVEFEDPKIPIGQFGTMKLAASVDFPRELPTSNPIRVPSSDAANPPRLRPRHPRDRDTKLHLLAPNPIILGRAVRHQIALRHPTPADARVSGKLHLRTSPLLYIVI